MSLSLDHSPINSRGHTRQSLGWPHPVSIPVSIHQLLHWSVIAEKHITVLLQNS